MKLNPNEKLYCPIRREWIEGLPEERIRQSLIHRMVHELDFPLESLAVEKSIRRMPHLFGADFSQMPYRRMDIVCFAKGIHRKDDLYPLLLVECKAMKATKAALRQIIGYNYHVKSYFIALAAQDGIRTGWFDCSRNEYQFVSYLPSFQDLFRSVQTKSMQEI